MKKKTMGKTRHVMAWMNKAEFEHVMEYLYSKEPALQKHALHRISAWKGRYGAQGWGCCESDTVLEIGVCHVTSDVSSLVLRFSCSAIVLKCV